MAKVSMMAMEKRETTEEWILENFERLARERKELFDAAMSAVAWVGRQPTKADMPEYTKCRVSLKAALKQIAESDAA